MSSSALLRLLQSKIEVAKKQDQAVFLNVEQSEELIREVKNAFSAGLEEGRAEVSNHQVVVDLGRSTVMWVTGMAVAGALLTSLALYTLL